MDFPGINELLIVSKAQFRAVRETYNATSETLNRDIDSLIEWYKLQPHLPPIELDRVWLERLLIANKCSNERTKNKIDMLMSSKNSEADFFLNRDPEKTFNPSNLLDYRQNHDYCAGERYVMDTRDINSSMLTKINPLTYKKMYFIKKAYGNRVTSLHILFPNPLLELLLKFFKLILPPKLVNRLKVHPDLDSLYQDIPREILPKEYGGEVVASEELFDKWENELCSQKQLKYFKDLENIRSDESKRVVELLKDENFGVAGSFRSLNLD